MAGPLYRWFDARLSLGRLHRKFLRKSFPVHHSFFLGEIALFSFVTLVATGAFLSLNYEGSDRLVNEGGRQVPAAYSSVLAINRLPLGRLMRGIHHWSAHVMLAAILLHLVRVALTGAYKRPRELNWWIGLILLVATAVFSFTGYSLPNDAFAVTATTIGYGIASSIPWIGSWVAEVLFGGYYPAAHSLPRLLAAHILWMPALVGSLIGIHLLIMVKQKHTQPGYARRVAPGKVLGMPLWPEQAVTMLVLFFVYLGVVSGVSGFTDVHPIAVFGPPTAATPQVKPDWYFLWVYGILKLIPSSWSFHALGATFGPELWGGIILPLIVFLPAVLLPLIDRQRAELHYAELPSEHPFRTGVMLGGVALLGVATAAAYRDWLGVPRWLFWTLLLTVPLGVSGGVYLALRSLSRSGTASPQLDPPSGGGEGG